MSADHGERMRSGAPQLTYELGLRIRPQAWRSILAVVLGLIALGALLLASVRLGTVLDRTFGPPAADAQRWSLTPGAWVAGAALLALPIPISGAVQRAVYGAGSGSLWSITGRVRWRWAGTVLLAAAPLFAIVAVVYLSTLPSSPIRSASIPLAVLAAVLTPLQAIGEERLFRGLIGRALAAPFARPAAALAVSVSGSSLLFWLGHGALAPLSVVYYLAAGVGLWLTAQWTGGLEAGCVLHACANTLLVVPAILFDRLDATTTAPGPLILLPAALWLVMPFVLRPIQRQTHRGPAKNRG